MKKIFTCGIYTANFRELNWELSIFPRVMGIIDKNGECVQIKQDTLLPIDDLIEIAVLMNNIKRQYKQLQCSTV